MVKSLLIFSIRHRHRISPDDNCEIEVKRYFFFLMIKIMAYNINRSYLALYANVNCKSQERSNVRAIAQDKIYGFAYCSVYAFYCTFSVITITMTVYIFNNLLLFKYEVSTKKNFPFAVLLPHFHLINFLIIIIYWFFHCRCFIVGERLKFFMEIFIDDLITSEKKKIF